ncbi:hypothetical protein Cgig2_025293 [Carnegiea gigantea]|uniref:Uncharacterized protein n=1 Tax=Carnegiea gigantea TaxID=171969 RepID=A0A9Q1KBW6_9CARY|nr:hypothetical protein Cgig2_025293 [Carnegiea gigantea]
MTNTLRKILKDQKAGRGEKEIVRKKLQLRLPVTKLALPPLRALHGLNCLSHKLRDGPRPLVLTYVKLEVTGRLSLVSRRLPKRSGTSPQPDSRRTKRKSYFQCFTFDFFSMAIMKLGLLLKQYHPKSPDLFNYRMKRKLETELKRRAINGNAFCGRLIHCGIHLGDHEGIPDRAPGNFDPSATISATNPSGAWPFLLSTDLPGADGPSGDEVLIDAPSEDELLDELSEEELDEAAPEVELELVEATSAFGLDEDGAEQGLPCVPSTSSSSGDLMRGGYITFTSGLRTLRVEEYSQLDYEGGHRIENFFGFPTFILSGNAGHHPAIDKGREASELGVPAVYLGAD